MSPLFHAGMTTFRNSVSRVFKQMFSTFSKDEEANIVSHTTKKKMQFACQRPHSACLSHMLEAPLSCSCENLTKVTC